MEHDITALRLSADRHVIALEQEIETVSDRLTRLELEEKATRELIGHLIAREEDAYGVAAA